MKTAMHTKLFQYYNTETLNILNNAAFLDPRFKSLIFLEEVEKTSTQLMIQEKICSLLLESDSGSGTSRTIESASISVVSNTSKDVIDVTPAVKRKKQSKFMELLSDVMNSTESSSTCEERARIELQWYVEDSSYDPTVHSLKWWYEKKSRYPTSYPYIT